MDWKDAKAKLLEDPELRKAYEKRDWSFELMKLWLDLKIFFKTKILRKKY